MRSCHDIMLSGKHENGVYQILNGAKNILHVYCDFGSEPGAAWTLVQSYSLEKRRNRRDTDMFSTKSLQDDYAVNGNWSSYRLSKVNMQTVREHSTQWRATCEFPTTGIEFRDYFRASLSNYDPLYPSTERSLSCKLYEFINIRGNQYINCTAATVVDPSTVPYLINTKTDVRCDLDLQPNGGTNGENNFGFYQVINSAFRCSATSTSTTQ